MNDQAVAFALHALEPDEELAMRTHLPGCRSCRETVRETELVMGELAMSVEQTDPPARLRANLLARAADTPQVDPAGASASPSVTSERRPDAVGPSRRGAGGGVRRETPAGTGPGRSRQGWRTRGARRLLAAAVAVVAVIGVGGLAVRTAQVQQERDALFAQSQSLADLVTQLDRPGTTHATLSSTDGQPVAAVLATASERAVVTAGLPPNDRADSIYVVWGLGEGDPRPLGGFDVTAPGPGIHQVDLAADGTQFSGYAVTLEPGRAVPPSAKGGIVASGEVQT